MPPGLNPLKLNKLQLRTLVLLQALARQSDTAEREEATGDVKFHQLPEPHGDHVHIGDHVVSSRDASGLYNPAVWTALGRRRLARLDAALGVTLTAAGVAYDTGLSVDFGTN